MKAPTLLGILNITEDSFSDGAKYLEPDAALAQGRKLARDGAAILDIGAASSNPDAKAVAPEIEIARLASVVPAFKAEGIALSIDTFALPVQRWALAQGVDYLNDIQGFPHAALYPELAASPAKLIVMHAAHGLGPALRDVTVPASEIYDRVVRFFEVRLAALRAAGIAPDRLILDPGMGLFLGRDREASFTVLRRIADLKAAFGLPILVSVSRKSFLRTLVGREAAEAGPVSLAAELFAALQGADYIRTHEPAQLRDALKLWDRLATPRNPT
jgi:dihydropteroate synthase type 2